MAQYKYPKWLQYCDHEAYDALYAPRAKPENPGIYRCATCSDEIAVPQGGRLPSKSHHQHSTGEPIQWQLLVYAQRNS
jgi:hypothetical protein